MRDGWQVVATYLNEPEAEAARAYLEAEGIAAVISKDNVGGMGPQLDLQVGVKVLVADEDAEQAKAALEPPQGPGGGPWVCPGCGETSEAGFDTCWNCGRERQ